MNLYQNPIRPTCCLLCHSVYIVHVIHTLVYILQDSCFNEKAQQTHFELPFQVNYMGRSVRTVPYSHTDFARSDHIALRLVKSSFDNEDCMLILL